MDKTDLDYKDPQSNWTAATIYTDSERVRKITAREGIDLGSPAKKELESRLLSQLGLKGLRTELPP